MRYCQRHTLETQVRDTLDHLRAARYRLDQELQQLTPAVIDADSARRKARADYALVAG